MSEEELSQYQKNTITRAALILQAHFYNRHSPFFPLSLSEYIKIPEWQVNAANAILDKAFQKLNPQHGLEMPLLEFIGFLEGTFEAAEKSCELGFAQIEEIEHLLIPDGIELPKPIPEDKIHEIEEQFQNLPLESLAQYHAGHSDGLQSVLKSEDEFRYSSDRIELYLIMLIFAEDLHYLDSWSAIHELVIQFLPSFKGRLDTLKRSMYKIGFRLNSA